MSLGRTVLRFAFLAAIGHQITHTLVEGGILENSRRRLSSIDPRIDEFIHCHLCVGSWVGAVLAVIYRPNLLAAVDGKPPSAARELANVAGDAVLIALGSSVWNEVLGWLRREVQVKQKRIEVADEPESIDLERRPLPGISLRSERNPGRGLSRI